MTLAALLLLSLLGYSAGVVLTAGGRDVRPGLLDLIAAVPVWAAAIAVRGELGEWAALAVAPPLALLAGGGGSLLRRSLAGQPSAPAAAGGWRAAGRRVGDFQGRMLMGLLYFVVVPPFALVARLTSVRGSRPAESHWIARPESPDTLDRARQQF